MKNLLKRRPYIYTMAKGIRDVLKSIWGRYRLKRQLKNRAPIKIIVGAAGYGQPGWIPTDVQYLNLLNNEHWKRFFNYCSIDAIVAEHVWEHLSLADGIEAAKNCYAYLRPGAFLRIAVPDGYNPDKKYIDYVNVGGSGPGADDHKMLYTYETLEKLLKSCGFTTSLLEYWDDSGNFHFKQWDVSEGKIHRSKRFDRRNQNGQLKYTSLIVDAHKY